MNNELKKLLHEQIEQSIFHLPLEDEYSFYRRIALGDFTILDSDLLNDPSEGMGILSRDNVRNSKYHLIILIAMITRFCIEAGLDSETGYTLSDLYIRKIDVTNDKSTLMQLKKDAITEYVKTMSDLQKNSITSFPVIKGINYIQRNITNPISADDVGKSLSCNPDYLSRLFKKETGRTLGQYILDAKCKTACYMLENSNESITDIAVFLGFSSSSHFIKRFKQCMNVSPAQYRKSQAIYMSNSDDTAAAKES